MHHFELLYCNDDVAKYMFFFVNRNATAVSLP